MSGVSVKGSRPESRNCGAISGTSRGVKPGDTLGDGWICAGVVPQQPPTILTRPDSANSPTSARHILRALVIEAEFVRQAGVGIGADQRISDARQLGQMGAHLARAERAVEADRERAAYARSEFQKAVGVWPDRVRPERSVIVPEIITGRRRPSFSNMSSMPAKAALAFSVSKIVSMIRRSAPPSIKRFGRLGIGSAQFVESDGAKARIVDIGRDRRGAVGRAERARDETAAAVFRRRASSAASRQSRAASRFNSGDKLFHAVIGLGDRVEEKVLVATISAPACEIGEMDRLDRVGLRQDQKIVVAAQIARPIGETCAAEIGLGELDASGSSCPWRRRAPGCALVRRLEALYRCRTQEPRDIQRTFVSSLRPQAEQMADRIDEIGPVHRVEMEIDRCP